MIGWVYGNGRGGMGGWDMTITSADCRARKSTLPPHPPAYLPTYPNFSSLGGCVGQAHLLDFAARLKSTRLHLRYENGITKKKTVGSDPFVPVCWLG